MFANTSEAPKWRIRENPKTSGGRSRLYVNCENLPPDGREFSTSETMLRTTSRGRLTSGSPDTIAEISAIVSEIGRAHV